MYCTEDRHQLISSSLGREKKGTCIKAREGEDRHSEELAENEAF